jgi:hypothetical protein
LGRNLFFFFRLVSKGLALLADLTSTYGLHGAGAVICVGRTYSTRHTGLWPIEFACEQTAMSRMDMNKKKDWKRHDAKLVLKETCGKCYGLMWQGTVNLAGLSIFEYLISNFRRVLNVVCFLLGNSPASEFYMPTFRNTLSIPSSQAGRRV